MPKTIRKPSYLLHQSTGQARVRIGGRDHYLGVYGSSESRHRYDELIGEWSRGRELSASTITLDDLVIRFLDHVGRYYRKGDRPTSEVDNIRQALRPLVRLFGPQRVREFGPLKLAAVRDELIRLGFVRTSINRHLARIRSMLKWGVSQELVPETVYRAVCTVAGLKAGRSAAKESPPVRPVSWDLVEAVRTHV